MGTHIKLAALIAVIAGTLPSARAAVDGTVVNGTSGKPQPGAAVTLLSMGEGSVAIKGTATSDESGSFRIDQALKGPHLLQAVHQGVTYNRMLQPGTPSTGVMIEVYDVSDAVGATKVLRHAVLLEPAGWDLSVRENILLMNEGKVTFHGGKGGAFRFYVPRSADESLRVTSRSPNGMPLQQTPAKADEPGVYQLDLPIKPGETQLDLSYTLPFRSPGEFRGRTLQTDVPVRLVVPSGVSLEGEGLRFLGQETKTQASNYVVETPEYRVMVRAGVAPAASRTESAASDSRPTQILPRIYDNLYSILALAFASLAIGFVRLYRMNPACPPVPAAAARQSRLKAPSTGKPRRERLQRA